MSNTQNIEPTKELLLIASDAQQVKQSEEMKDAEEVDAAYSGTNAKKKKQESKPRIKKAIKQLSVTERANAEKILFLAATMNKFMDKQKLTFGVSESRGDTITNINGALQEMLGTLVAHDYQRKLISRLICFNRVPLAALVGINHITEHIKRFVHNLPAIIYGNIYVPDLTSATKLQVVLVPIDENEKETEKMNTKLGVFPIAPSFENLFLIPCCFLERGTIDHVERILTALKIPTLVLREPKARYQFNEKRELCLDGEVLLNMKMVAYKPGPYYTFAELTKEIELKKENFTDLFDENHLPKRLYPEGAVVVTKTTAEILKRFVKRLDSVDGLSVCYDKLNRLNYEALTMAEMLTKKRTKIEFPQPDKTGKVSPCPVNELLTKTGQDLIDHIDTMDLNTKLAFLGLRHQQHINPIIIPTYDIAKEQYKALIASVSTEPLLLNQCIIKTGKPRKPIRQKHNTDEDLRKSRKRKHDDSVKPRVTKQRKSVMEEEESDSETGEDIKSLARAKQKFSPVRTLPHIDSSDDEEEIVRPISKKAGKKRISHILDDTDDDEIDMLAQKSFSFDSDGSPAAKKRKCSRSQSSRNKKKAITGKSFILDEAEEDNEFDDDSNDEHFINDNEEDEE